MKILFGGGGTGGHFYPIIAIAEKINKIADQEKILGVKMYYMSDSPYDKSALFEQGIKYEYVPAGKMRLYFSIRNFFDIFKVFFGVLTAVIKLFTIFPDVVFGKGGYASFPALMAARILRIPVFIHESDSAPGRVNKWAGKFAKRVAVSYEECAQYFPKDKTAWTGQPVREDLKMTLEEGAFEYLKLDKNIPVIFVEGGSLGAQVINNNLLDVLPELLNKYQIIHQTGKENFEDVSGRARVIIGSHPNKDNYKAFPFLNKLAMKMSGGAAEIIVSRAGAGAIAEIASWGKPSIIIPITNSNGDHQRKNAFSYARAGACSVIEEINLTPSILVAEINKLMDDSAKREEMSKNAKAFSKPDAALTIAREIINMALEHEK